MKHYYTNNADLKSEMIDINYEILNNKFVFFSDNGVFSKKKIDFGSELLINSYLENNNECKKILDVGCGYGVIGIVISKVTNSEIDMIDVNNRSIHLTKMNIKRNKINGNAFISDAYQNVNDKYDLIITNPPIRVGNTKVLEIINGAKEHLKKNGELWFVIRKNQGALTLVEKIKNTYNVEIVCKSKGYFIFKAKTC